MTVSGSSNLKSLIYLAGTLLFAASLLFIALYAARNWQAVADVRILGPGWLAASVVLYAVSHVSTGLSWPLTLRQLRQPISIADGFRIGLVSQAGKYLPGNVAHYVGRGGLGSTAGIPVRASSVSVAVELTSALAAAVLVVSLMLCIDSRPLDFLPQWGWKEVGAASVIGVGALALVGWAAWRGYSALLFFAPIACLAISFILSGLSFHALVSAVGHGGELSVPVAIGAFTLAWAGGFILPGAPAGLGVREAILVSLIGPAIGPGPTLACVLLHRLMTAVVDGAAALLGYAWFASAMRSKT